MHGLYKVVCLGVSSRGPALLKPLAMVPLRSASDQVCPLWAFGRCLRNVSCLYSGLHQEKISGCSGLKPMPMS